MQHARKKRKKSWKPKCACLENAVLTFLYVSATVGYIEQKTKTVLVIENHTFSQEVYNAIFSDEYTVAIAASYSEALEKLQQGEWDVVVLDMLYQGGINGIALLETYKKHNAGYADILLKKKKQPVFIAIVDDEDHMEKIRELADEVFIMGKFTPGDVLEKVQACLQKKQELEAAQSS